MTAAKKNDLGKTKYNLLPPHALEAVAQIMTYGAEKYGEYNYLAGGGLEPSRLFAAAQRHLWAHFRDSEMLDPESGLPHLAHAAASIMMMFETLKTFTMAYEEDEKCKDC